MAVAWRVVQARPSELQKTLEELTAGDQSNRYRILSVTPTPADEPTYNSTTFTVVSYRLTADKRSRNTSRHQRYVSESNDDLDDQQLTD